MIVKHRFPVAELFPIPIAASLAGITTFAEGRTSCGN